MISLIIAVNCFIAIKASLIGDSIKEDFEQIKQYELFYFQNTDSFVAGNDINFLEFDAFNQHFKLKLTLNDNYPSVVRHEERSTELSPIEDHIPCHYKGEAIEPMDPTIRYISVSVCNNRGVRAFIITEDDEYVIHPALHYLDPDNEPSDGHQLHHQHLIYKHSDNFPSSSPPKSKSLATNTNTNLNTRRRLPYDSENVIETFILVDPVYCDSFKDQYGSSRWYDEMVDFIQDFVNAASGEYESTNFGYNSGTFSIKLVRLEVVESWTSNYRSLQFDMNRDEYDGRDGGSGFRRKFRDWAERNVDQDFDFGAIYTMHSDGGGAAWKNGICSSSNHYMHSASDGSASSQRKLLAHELGHNLGMEHDEKSECWDSEESSSSNKDKCPYTCANGNIMGDGNYNTNGFSSCSKKYLRDYMEKRDGFSCLKSQSNSLEIVKDGYVTAARDADNNNDNSDPNNNDNSDPYDYGDYKYDYGDYKYDDDDTGNPDDGNSDPNDPNEPYDYNDYNPDDNGPGGPNESNDPDGPSPPGPPGDPSDPNEPNDPNDPNDPYDYNDYNPDDNNDPNDGPSGGDPDDNNDPNDPYDYNDYNPDDNNDPNDGPGGGDPNDNNDPNDGPGGRDPDDNNDPNDPYDYNDYNPDDNNDPNDGPGGDPNNNYGDSSCLMITSLTMNRKDFSGEWQETGITYNDKPSYKLDGRGGTYYIYQCEWGDYWNYWFDWGLSGSLGSEHCWDYGFCTEEDILDCDGKWEDDYELDDNCEFNSCGALVTDTVDGCLESDSYSDAVCVYDDGIESDHVLYEVDQVWGCHYEHPVYRYVDDDGTHYLHFNSHGSWIISNDNLHNYGSHQCDDEDLFNCTDGKWSIEVTHDDVDSVEIHPTMTVESCGSMASVKGEDGAISMTIVLVMACIAIAVSIVIGVGCIWKAIRKKDTYGFRGEEIPDEEEIEIEVEAEAIIDNETNTTV